MSGGSDLPSRDTATQFGGWLKSLGLGQYEAVFIENAIDADVVAELTEADLEKLGMPMGDRKRLMRATKAGPPVMFAMAGRQSVGRGAKSPSEAGERRQLTVMICDLVGSTALSTQLDPEDLSAVMDTYHTVCARVARSYDGYIAQFQGDGLLVCFGYPRAHEDDAERTVRAALDIVAAVAELVTPVGKPLSVRVGIATGLVVVGDLSSASVWREHAIVGDTPNIAARLHGLADPGMIVVAASTRRLLSHLFRLRDLGRHLVKGLEEPVSAWVVEGLSGSVSRFEAKRTTAAADLFGRKNEIGVLLDRKRQAWNGDAQIVLISGEAGIGKSRLAAALIERIGDQSFTRLVFQCSPYHTNSALHPITVHLEQAAGFRHFDTVSDRYDKLEALLAVDMDRRQEVASLFAALLSIPASDRYPPLDLEPAEQRRRTLESLILQFEGLAKQKPILFLFEDVHWADATSLGLIDLAIARGRHWPILALFTFRPEFQPPWTALPNVTTMSLDGLGQEDVESMVTLVAGGRAMPAEVMKGIVAKTDVNPLFVEELTKAVLESGVLLQDDNGYAIDGTLPPLAIPATLQDSLMARLDRLTPMKDISQIGAAIGREFRYALLRAVVGGDAVALNAALTQLEQSELVFRRGEGSEAVYTFKHALIRDAAYESTLKSRRQQMHQRIGRALETGFPDIVAKEPETVAHHFTEAGLYDQAIDYWLKAGSRTLARSANAEAVKHLRRGIELVNAQAGTPERLRRELDLCLALGPALAAAAGYAMPETMKIFSRARELLGDQATLTEQMTVLWGSFLAHSTRGENIASLQVARQCLALAEEADHPGMSSLANRFMGQILANMGEFQQARIHLERVVAICDDIDTMAGDFRKFGIDDRAGAAAHLARVLLLLGYPDQSLKQSEQALSRARNLGLPFTISLVLAHEALTGVMRWDPSRATVIVDDAITYSVEHGLLPQERLARLRKGALMAQTGDPRGGLEIMLRAMAAERKAVGGRIPAYFSAAFAQIADARASLGEPEAGLQILDEAIQMVNASEERFHEAELIRLRGIMLSMLGRKDQAETEFQQALSISRQQQARWWELRVTTSLAAHWMGEGKYEEARALLQPAYDWFSEGFETKILRDAKAVLDELGQRAPVLVQHA